MRITPVKAVLFFMSDGTYPVGMRCNELEIRDFIEVFNTMAEILKLQQFPTPESKDGYSVLNGLAASFNQYLDNKSTLPPTDLSTEVTADFHIYPLENCNVLYEFKPLNIISTEAIWFSWDEVRVINNSLTLAKSLSQNEENSLLIENIVNSFASFIVDCDPLLKV